MNKDEQEVIAAASRLYEAIEQMASGKGLDAMSDAWHHNDRVTTGHPSGDWAQGWDEVWATWQVFASFGKAGRGGTSFRDMKAHVYGDIAYTTCTFVSSAAFGGDTMSCTNVLQRTNGVWKVIHHHADKSPSMGPALERLLAEG